MNGPARSFSSIALSVAVVATTLAGPSKVAASGDMPSTMQTVFNQVDGIKGYALKRLGPGGTTWTLNSTFVYEPASSIKFLHALHAERQVQANNGVALTQAVDVPNSLIGSCPVESPTHVEALDSALYQMMTNSSNQHTEAIKDEFGQAAINATAWSLGATHSGLHHRLGCGADALAHPNQLTLDDITLLYQKAFTDDATLTPFRRQHLWSRMNSSMQQLVDTANSEAQLNYGTNALQQFLDNLKVAYKPGEYTLCSDKCRIYKSIAGYVEIPTRIQLLGKWYVVPRKYVFGLFIHGATDWVLDTPGDYFVNTAYDQGCGNCSATS
jgi:Beta-lactamase enzyme family